MEVVLVKSWQLDYFQWCKYLNALYLIYLVISNLINVFITCPDNYILRFFYILGHSGGARKKVRVWAGGVPLWKRYRIWSRRSSNSHIPTQLYLFNSDVYYWNAQLSHKCLPPSSSILGTCTVRHFLLSLRLTRPNSAQLYPFYLIKTTWNLMRVLY